MSYNTTISPLLADGWQEHPDPFRDYARCFYKQFDTPTRCACNSNKEGMQVRVAISKRDDSHSYKISLHGELPDGTWIKLTNHRMPEDIEKGLATISRLLATWEFMCAHKQAPPCARCGGKGHYMYDDMHGKPCEQCCPHSNGWWQFSEGYAGYMAGADNGCCLSGCGQLRRELPQTP